MMKKQIMLMVTMMGCLAAGQVHAQSSQLPYGDLVGDALPVIGPIEFRVEAGMPKTIVLALKEAVREVNNQIDRDVFAIKGVMARGQSAELDNTSTMTMESNKTANNAMVTSNTYYGAGEVSEVDLVIHGDRKTLSEADPIQVKKAIKAELMQLFEGME